MVGGKGEEWGGGEAEELKGDGVKKGTRMI